MSCGVSNNRPRAEDVRLEDRISNTYLRESKGRGSPNQHGPGRFSNVRLFMMIGLLHRSLCACPRGGRATIVALAREKVGEYGICLKTKQC